MNIPPLIPVLAAMVLIGLGGFFFYRYGVTNYNAGYNQCIGDGVALATKASEELKNVIRKAYSPSDVDRMLRLNGWMREDSDR